MKWYEHEKNKNYFVQFGEPFSNIFQGEGPSWEGMTFDFVNSFDHYLNVSFTPLEVLGYNKELDAQFHWFPLGEIGFYGFESLYWFKKKLDLFHSRDEKVFIHCEAGVSRSPTMSLCWLLSHTKDIRKAASIMANYDTEEIEQEIKRFNHHFDSGNIPSAHDLIYFYENYFDEDNKHLIDGVRIDDERLSKYYKA